MKKLLSPAAGHAVCLAVVLMICSVALIVIKAFLPAFILPRITITLLVMLSLVALVAEHFLFGSDGTTQYLETGLLAAAAFWMMTWAVGLATCADAGKVVLAGGVIYLLCLLVFTAMRSKLDSSPIRHKGAALTLAAALLLLACQSLAGLPILA